MEAWVLLLALSSEVPPKMSGTFSTLAERREATTEVMLKNPVEGAMAWCEQTRIEHV